MDSYTEALAGIAGRARALRILLNLRQEDVAERAGVGLMTVRRFERRGQASFENVLRIAHALRAEQAFEQLFMAPKYRSIDEALARPVQRQRVRKAR